MNIFFEKGYAKKFVGGAKMLKLKQQWQSLKMTVSLVDIY